ncbi:hypothetical protein EI94DRAFT_625954 [Lactarius quietus]|nr:hypothetical protein EI94DRAFT_625954 [Lactarius quietus]
MTHHYDTYREELAKAYPGFGYALWEADPGEHNPSIGVGDVGFTHAGRFYRLFNALLPADHSSNEIYGVPTDHEPLQPSRPDHINRGALAPNTFHSHGVTVVSGGIGVLASSTIGSAEVSFSCTREYGAILTLPVAARREDTVVLGLFRRWVIKNIDSWFAFAQELDLEIAMEDIILVTGCHRTRSWTNIAFNEAQADARLSLKVDVADASGANITWGSNDQIQGAEHNQGPSGKNLPENQCIFIRGYRVKRCLSPGRRDHQPAKEGMSISRATENISRNGRQIATWPSFTMTTWNEFWELGIEISWKPSNPM